MTNTKSDIALVHSEITRLQALLKEHLKDWTRSASALAINMEHAFCFEKTNSVSHQPAVSFPQFSLFAADIRIMSPFFGHILQSNTNINFLASRSLQKCYHALSMIPVHKLYYDQSIPDDLRSLLSPSLSKLTELVHDGQNIHKWSSRFLEDYSESALATVQELSREIFLLENTHTQIQNEIENATKNLSFEIPQHCFSLSEFKAHLSSICQHIMSTFATLDQTTKDTVSLMIQRHFQTNKILTATDTVQKELLHHSILTRSLALLNSKAADATVAYLKSTLESMKREKPVIILPIILHKGVLTLSAVHRFSFNHPFRTEKALSRNLSIFDLRRFITSQEKAKKSESASELVSTTTVNLFSVFEPLFATIKPLEGTEDIVQLTRKVTQTIGDIEETCRTYVEQIEQLSDIWNITPNELFNSFLNVKKIDTSQQCILVSDTKTTIPSLPLPLIVMIERSDLSPFGRPFSLGKSVSTHPLQDALGKTYNPPFAIWQEYISFIQSFSTKVDNIPSPPQMDLISIDIRLLREDLHSLAARWKHPLTQFLSAGIIRSLKLTKIIFKRFATFLRSNKTEMTLKETVDWMALCRDAVASLQSLPKFFSTTWSRIVLLRHVGIISSELFTLYQETAQMHQIFAQQDLLFIIDDWHIKQTSFSSLVNKKVSENLALIEETYKKLHNPASSPLHPSHTQDEVKDMLLQITIPSEEINSFLYAFAGYMIPPVQQIKTEFERIRDFHNDLGILWEIWRETNELIEQRLFTLPWTTLVEVMNRPDNRQTQRFLFSHPLEQLSRLQEDLHREQVFVELHQFLISLNSKWRLIQPLLGAPLNDWHWEALLTILNPTNETPPDLLKSAQAGTMMTHKLFEFCSEEVEQKTILTFLETVEKDDAMRRELGSIRSFCAQIPNPLMANELDPIEAPSPVVPSLSVTDKKKTSRSKSKKKKKRTLRPFPRVDHPKCIEMLEQCAIFRTHVATKLAVIGAKEIMDEAKLVLAVIFQITQFLEQLLVTREVVTQLITLNSIDTTSHSDIQKDTMEGFSRLSDDLRVIHFVVHPESERVCREMRRMTKEAQVLIHSPTHQRLVTIAKRNQPFLMLNMSQMISYLRSFSITQHHPATPIITTPLIPGVSKIFTTIRNVSKTATSGTGDFSIEVNELRASSGEIMRPTEGRIVIGTDIYLLPAYVRNTISHQLRLLMATVSAMDCPIYPQMFFLSVRVYISEMYRQLQTFLDQQRLADATALAESIQINLSFSLAFLMTLVRISKPLTNWSATVSRLLSRFQTIVEGLLDKLVRSHRKHTVSAEGEEEEEELESLYSIHQALDPNKKAVGSDELDEDEVDDDDIDAGDVEVDELFFFSLVRSLIFELHLRIKLFIVFVTSILPVNPALTAIDTNPFLTNNDFHHRTLSIDSTTTDETTKTFILTPPTYPSKDCATISVPVTQLYFGTETLDDPVTIDYAYDWIPFSPDDFAMPFTPSMIAYARVLTTCASDIITQVYPRTGILNVVKGNELEPVMSHAKSFAHSYGRNVNVFTFSPSTSLLLIKKTLATALLSGDWLLLAGLEHLSPFMQTSLTTWLRIIRLWRNSQPNVDGNAAFDLEGLSLDIRLPLQPWLVLGFYRRGDDYDGELPETLTNEFKVVAVPGPHDQEVFVPLILAEGFIHPELMQQHTKAFFSALCDLLPSQFKHQKQIFIDHCSSLTFLRQIATDCGIFMRIIMEEFEQNNTFSVKSRREFRAVVNGYPLNWALHHFQGVRIGNSSNREVAAECRALRHALERAAERLLSLLTPLSLISYSEPDKFHLENEHLVSVAQSVPTILDSIFSPVQDEPLKMPLDPVHQACMSGSLKPPLHAKAENSKFTLPEAIVPRDSQFAASVASLYSIFSTHPAIHLHGMSGSGKTNLVSVMSQVYSTFHSITPVIVHVQTPFVSVSAPTHASSMAGIHATFFHTLREFTQMETLKNQTPAPIWVLIDISTVSCLRVHGAILEELCGCSFSSMDLDVSLHFPEHCTLTLPKHSKIIFESSQPFFTSHHFIPSSTIPFTVSFDQPILMRWKLDHWIQHVKTEMDNSVLDVIPVMLRVNLTSVIDFFKLSDQNNTAQSQLSCSSLSGMLENTLIILRGVLKLDQVRFNRPLDGSLLRVYVLYACVRGFGSHFQEVPDAMNEYLTWFQKWKESIPDTFESPINASGRNMMRTIQQITPGGAVSEEMEGTKRPPSLAKQFDDYVKKTLLLENERYGDYPLWMYVPDVANKLLLPYTDVETENCLIPFNRTVRFDPSDWTRSGDFQNFVIPLLLLLDAGRHVAFVDDMPCEAKPIVSNILQTFVQEAKTNPVIQKCFTQATLDQITNFHHAPLFVSDLNINQRSSLPSEIITNTEHESTKSHILPIHFLMNDTDVSQFAPDGPTTSFHLSPLTTSSPRVIFGSPAVWIVSSSVLEARPDLAGPFSHTMVFSIDPLSLGNLSRLGEQIWDQKIRERLSLQLPEIIPLIFQMGMIPATLYIMTVVRSRSPYYVRVTVKQYLEVIRLMVSADAAIIENPTIFGWYWLWEIERVFLSMQLRADQQRFVQSLCRSSFINFFPASITNLDKKRTKDKKWSSSFLNHFISSPWPVDSLVPLDFTVYPYFFETITGRDNQRTTVINPDVTSPIQFLFNEINLRNPHDASHVDHRLSQLSAICLSHATTASYLQLFETLRYDTSPLFFTNTEGLSATTTLRSVLYFLGIPHTEVPFPYDGNSLSSFIDMFASCVARNCSEILPVSPSKFPKRPDISHRPTPSQILRQPEVKECFVVAIRHQTLVVYIFRLLVAVFVSRTYPFALTQGRINAQKQRVTNLSPDIETLLVYSMSRLVHFMGKESMDEEDVETVLRQASQRIRLVFLISNDSVTSVRDILDPLLNVGTIACPVSIDDHAKREIIANFLHRYITPLSFYFVRLSGTRRDSARDKDALNYRQFNSHRDQVVQTARMKAKERQRDADKSNDIVDSMFNALSDIFTRVHGAHSALGHTRTIWNVSDVDVFFGNIPTLNLSYEEFVRFLDLVCRLLVSTVGYLVAVKKSVSTSWTQFEVFKKKTEELRQTIVDSEMLVASQPSGEAMNDVVKMIDQAIRRRETMIREREDRINRVSDYNPIPESLNDTFKKLQRTVVSRMSDIFGFTDQTIVELNHAGMKNESLSILLDLVKELIYPNVDIKENFQTHVDALLLNLLSFNLGPVPLNKLMSLSRRLEIGVLPDLLPAIPEAACTLYNWMRNILRIKPDVYKTLDDETIRMFDSRFEIIHLESEVNKLRFDIQSLNEQKRKLSPLPVTSKDQPQSKAISNAKTCLLKAEDVVFTIDDVMKTISQELLNADENMTNALGDSIFTAAHFVFGPYFFGHSKLYFMNTIVKQILATHSIPFSSNVDPVMHLMSLQFDTLSQYGAELPRPAHRHSSAPKPLFMRSQSRQSMFTPQSRVSSKTHTVQNFQSRFEFLSDLMSNARMFPITMTSREVSELETDILEYADSHYDGRSAFTLRHFSHPVADAPIDLQRPQDTTNASQYMFSGCQKLYIDVLADIFYANGYVHVLTSPDNLKNYSMLPRFVPKVRFFLPNFMRIPLVVDPFEVYSGFPSSDNPSSQIFNLYKTFGIESPQDSPFVVSYIDKQADKKLLEALKTIGTHPTHTLVIRNLNDQTMTPLVTTFLTQYFLAKLASTRIQFTLQPSPEHEILSEMSTPLASPIHSSLLNSPPDYQYSNAQLSFNVDDRQTFKITFTPLQHGLSEDSFSFDLPDDMFLLLLSDTHPRSTFHGLWMSFVYPIIVSPTEEYVRVSTMHALARQLSEVLGQLSLMKSGGQTLSLIPNHKAAFNAQTKRLQSRRQLVNRLRLLSDRVVFPHLLIAPLNLKKTPLKEEDHVAFEFTGRDRISGLILRQPSDFQTEAHLPPLETASRSRTESIALNDDQLSFSGPYLLGRSPHQRDYEKPFRSHRRNVTEMDLMKIPLSRSIRTLSMSQLRAQSVSELSPVSSEKAFAASQLGQQQSVVETSLNSSNPSPSSKQSLPSAAPETEEMPTKLSDATEADMPEQLPRPSPEPDDQVARLSLTESVATLHEIKLPKFERVTLSRKNTKKNIHSPTGRDPASSPTTEDNTSVFHKFDLPSHFDEDSSIFPLHTLFVDHPDQSTANMTQASVAFIPSVHGTLTNLQVTSVNDSVEDALDSAGSHNEELHSLSHLSDTDMEIPHSASDDSSYRDGSETSSEHSDDQDPFRSSLNSMQSTHTATDDLSASDTSDQDLMAENVAALFLAFADWDPTHIEVTAPLTMLTNFISYNTTVESATNTELNLFALSFKWCFTRIAPLSDSVSTYLFLQMRITGHPFAQNATPFFALPTFHHIIQTVIDKSALALKEEYGQAPEKFAVEPGFPSNRPQDQSLQAILEDRQPAAQFNQSAFFRLLQRSPLESSPLNYSERTQTRILESTLHSLLSIASSQINKMDDFIPLLFFIVVNSGLPNAPLSHIELQILIHNRAFVYHLPPANMIQGPFVTLTTPAYEYHHGFDTIEMDELILPYETMCLYAHGLMPDNPVPVFLTDITWKNVFTLAAVLPSYRPFVEDLDDKTTQLFASIDHLPPVTSISDREKLFFDSMMFNMHSFEENSRKHQDSSTESDGYLIDVLDDESREFISRHSRKRSTLRKPIDDGKKLSPQQIMWMQWLQHPGLIQNPTPNREMNTLNLAQRTLFLLFVGQHDLTTIVRQVATLSKTVPLQFNTSDGHLPSIVTSATTTTRTKNHLVPSSSFFCGHSSLVEYVKSSIRNNGGKRSLRIALQQLTITSSEFSVSFRAEDVIGLISRTARMNSKDCLFVHLTDNVRSIIFQDARRNHLKSDFVLDSLWEITLQQLNRAVSMKAWVVISGLSLVTSSFIKLLTDWMREQSSTNLPPGLSDDEIFKEQTVIWFITTPIEEPILKIHFAHSSSEICSITNKVNLQIAHSFRGLLLQSLILIMENYPSDTLLKFATLVDPHATYDGIMFKSVCHIVFSIACINALLLEYVRIRVGDPDSKHFKLNLLDVISLLSTVMQRMRTVVKFHGKKKHALQNGIEGMDWVSFRYIVVHVVFSTITDRSLKAVTLELSSRILNSDRFGKNNGVFLYPNVPNPEDINALPDLDAFFRVVTVNPISPEESFIKRQQSIESKLGASIVEQCLAEIVKSNNILSPLMSDDKVRLFDPDLDTWTNRTSRQAFLTNFSSLATDATITHQEDIAISRIQKASIASSSSRYGTAIAHMKETLGFRYCSIEKLTAECHQIFGQNYKLPQVVLHLLREGHNFNIMLGRLYDFFGRWPAHLHSGDLPMDQISTVTHSVVDTIAPSLALGVFFKEKPSLSTFSVFLYNTDRRVDQLRNGFFIEMTTKRSVLNQTDFLLPPTFAKELQCFRRKVVPQGWVELVPGPLTRDYSMLECFEKYINRASELFKIFSFISPNARMILWEKDRSSLLNVPYVGNRVVYPHFSHFTFFTPLSFNVPSLLTSVRLDAVVRLLTTGTTFQYAIANSQPIRTSLINPADQKDPSTTLSNVAVVLVTTTLKSEASIARQGLDTARDQSPLFLGGTVLSANWRWGFDYDSLQFSVQSEAATGPPRTEIQATTRSLLPNSTVHTHSLLQLDSLHRFMRPNQSSHHPLLGLPFLRIEVVDVRSPPPFLSAQNTHSVPLMDPYTKKQAHTTSLLLHSSTPLVFGSVPLTMLSVCP
ncbi:hypothetical protein BLNAU_5944 [Blattamonas nauphoetae]|uniref:Dynein heavy chain n=1 Tax=Blattamonas nauphoetae TaxID=2049346 RepID=A0ABQ9Y617_9EUKA|nr:hypothetical protein BLNAU_5944 [Blattamonas nauphoetae]